MTAMQNKFENSNLMSEDEIELREKIAEFVNRKDAYKNFDAQVRAHVLGQKNLSEITYNVFMWLRGLAENCTIRNNAMIAAPSGCGKTETYRVIKEILNREIADIPVIQLDVTKLTSEGFRGMNTNDFFEPLFSASINGIAIVVLDEIDKRLLPDHNGDGDNVNAAIQSQLLTFIEGTEIGEDEDCRINTSNTLFIAAGAFQQIRDNRKKEAKVKSASSIGFLADTSKKHGDIALDDDISLADILESGAMYEFVGRFSTLINLHMLDLETVKIIVGRYAAEFGKSLKCKICVSETVVEEMYEKYLTSGLGCRILRNELWKRISPIGMEIERNNLANRENEIEIICDIRGDMYVVNKKVYKMERENVA